MRFKILLLIKSGKKKKNEVSDNSVYDLIKITAPAASIPRACAACVERIEMEIDYVLYAAYPKLL